MPLKSRKKQEELPPEPGLPPEDAAAPAGPGLSEEEAVGAFEESSDASGAEQTEAIGATAPEARESLDPARLTALSQTVTMALQEIGDGQIPTGEPLTVEEPQDQIPGPIFAGVASLAAFADQFAPAKAFQFDPFELGIDNAGLAELIAVVGRMGRDKALARAVKSEPVQAEPEAEAPPAPEKEEDLDRFIA